MANRVIGCLFRLRQIPRINGYAGALKDALPRRPAYFREGVFPVKWTAPNTSATDERRNAKLKSKWNAQKKWHPWFAWHPVHITEQTRAWLCWVERRCVDRELQWWSWDIRNFAYRASGDDTDGVWLGGKPYPGGRSR